MRSWPSSAAFAGAEGGGASLRVFLSASLVAGRSAGCAAGNGCVAGGCFACPGGVSGRPAAGGAGLGPRGGSRGIAFAEDVPGGGGMRRSVALREKAVGAGERLIDHDWLVMIVTMRAWKY